MHCLILLGHRIRGVRLSVAAKISIYLYPSVFMLIRFCTVNWIILWVAYVGGGSALTVSLGHSYRQYEPLLLAPFHKVAGAFAMQESSCQYAMSFVFQLTTAVTSAFLLAKVILSKVWPTFSPLQLQAQCLVFPLWAHGNCISISRTHLFFQLFSQGAFGYVLPIISFILAWIETWFLDFKVLPQEAEEENSKFLSKLVS